MTTSYQAVTPEGFLWRTWHHVLLALTLLSVAGNVNAKDDLHVIDDFKGVDVVSSTPEVVSLDTVDSRLSITINCGGKRFGIVRIPLRRSVKDQKVRLHVSKAKRVPFTGKFEVDANGEPIPNTFESYFLEYQKTPIYYSLKDGYYEYLSLWFRCRSKSPDVNGVVRIDKVEIAPVEFTDKRDFTYILAVALLVLFLVPGFLVYGALFNPGGKEHLLALVTPLSMFFFLVLYGVLAAGQAIWSMPPDSWVLSVAYVVLIIALLAWLGARNRLGELRAGVASIRTEVLIVFVVMLCVTAIVTEELNLPLFTLTHHHMRYLTYGAFGAHDPMFQYVNGVALLHDEPFSKYYENYKLFNEVQDRGMIAGLIYSVVRGMGAPFDTGVAYSYGYYTLFGAGVNILALFPVFAMHKYFAGDKQRPWLLIFLMCASPFLVMNFFMTWFKLAGAGLVIAGIVLLLFDRHSIRQWVAAGVLWGLAANFHPSLALSYPIVTLWLLYRFWRARNGAVRPVLLAFGGLMAAFIVVMAPWEIVKELNYEDTSKLLREHFLASEPYDKEHGIVGTIGNFLDRYTLGEQLFTRYERLVQSFRIDEVRALIEASSEAGWDKVLVKWSQLETAYTVLAFAGLVVLLLVSTLLTRLLPATVWNEPNTQNKGDFRWLLATQALSILVIILGTYGKYPPDLTWNLPMSSLVLILYLLVHANIAAGRIGITLITVYSVFTHYRLFFQYF